MPPIQRSIEFVGRSSQTYTGKITDVRKKLRHIFISIYMVLDHAYEKLLPNSFSRKWHHKIGNVRS